LISYDPKIDPYHLAADYVDCIPSVQAPAKYQLVIYLKTAKARSAFPRQRKT